MIPEIPIEFAPADAPTACALVDGAGVESAKKHTIKTIVLMASSIFTMTCKKLNFYLNPPSVIVTIEKAFNLNIYVALLIIFL